MTEILETLDLANTSLWTEACRACGHVGEIGIDIWHDDDGTPICDNH